MNPEKEREIDDIIYETNGKISAIVEEIRQIRFSTMDEGEKQKKLDSLREEFEKVMLEEEKRVEDIMKKYA